MEIFHGKWKIGKTADLMIHLIQEKKKENRKKNEKIFAERSNFRWDLNSPAIQFLDLRQIGLFAPGNHHFFG